MSQRVARHLLHRDIMPGSLEGRSVKLEGGPLHTTLLFVSRSSRSIYSHQRKKSQSPPLRAHPRRHLHIRRTRLDSTLEISHSSDKSVVWGDTVNISSLASHKLSIEIRASFELDRMLGNDTSWDELLDHGNEPFNPSFPPVRGVRPSLILKATVEHACGDQDGARIDVPTLVPVFSAAADRASIAECEIARRRPHNICQIREKREHFQWVLGQRPVGHPDRAAALTNFAWVRLQGFIRKDSQEIESTTSLFRDAIALHCNRTATPIMRYLITVFNSLYIKERTAALSSGQLPSKLPIDAGIHLRRMVLELCPLGYQRRPTAFNKLSWSLNTRFAQCGSINDIDESIQLGIEAASLIAEGYSGRDIYFHNLPVSLRHHFGHQGEPHDLDEVISLYEEVLCLRPIGRNLHRDWTT
ncbi:uncharacterized protein EDB91DRAFT_1247225 [Suillus paluster]|uniref:uncharacterized protein n=1 Tax=Suillus paluster TaxID=48578 RepID=UPI001B8616B3|nr:uncharacterized protein EDB91DRAFT_1247225 [Suillus paluster]KAG1743742.1 hypothetical protein EDB91DRAFT_1247225 [Suillus paluster]